MNRITNLILAFEHLKNESTKGITFINGKDQEYFVAYQDIYRKAVAALCNLQSRGLKAGDELVIAVPDNEQFIVLFWACVLGKIIPVPVSAGGQEEYKVKLINIWRTLNNPFFAGNVPSLNKQKLPSEEKEETLEDIEKKSILPEAIMQGTAPGEVQAAAGEDLAYIQFSSGSTGEPKGVMLSHENLVANTRDIITSSEITNEDAILSWMPLTHDMGLICFHLTGVVANVNQYIIPTSLFIKRPLVWIDKASEYNVSMLYSPNFGLHYLLSALDEAHPYPWDLRSIRLIYNGAEPINQELCQRFTRQLSPYGLGSNVMYPGYGLAEASVAVTLSRVGAEVLSYTLDRSRVNIGDEIRLVDAADAGKGVNFVDVGYPIAHCRVRICSLEDQPLGDNTIGHIQIQGRNVTRGYYNNAKATAACFTADGWLRTGDLGFLREGRLVITGRYKNIIIRNGQNFYAQDLERVVQEVTGIDLGKIVACSNKSQAAKEELLVFVLFKGPAKDFLDTVLKIKEGILERFGLLVEKVIPVRKIPKTTSGKIQHYKLVEQYNAGAYADVTTALDALEKSCVPEWAEAHGTTEEKLVYLYQRIVGEGLASAGENFMERGINSLQAIRLIAGIARVFHVNLTLKEFFDNPTIGQLAALLHEKPLGPAVGQIEPVAAQERYDVSYTQKRFWVFHQYEPGAAFNISVAYAFRGNLNLDCFDKAFQTLIARHESLRTIFVATEGEPKQQVLPAGEVNFSIRCLDLRHEPDAEKMARETAVQASNVVFALDRAPLLAAVLMRLEDERFLFVLTIHHIVADGWSMGVMIEEVTRLYNGYLRGAPDPLPALEIQLKDYVHWQNRQLTEANLALSRAYWLEEFKDGVPVLNLPTARTRRETTGKRGKVLNVTLPKGVTEGLRNVSRDNNVTLFVSLLSICNVLFHKYTGSTDIVLGTDVAARNLGVLENQIGYYLNTLPIRTRFSAGQPFAGLLQTVREKFLAGCEHQAYPFDHLVKELATETEPGASPLFNVLVLLQNFSGDTRFGHLEGVAAEKLPNDSQTSFIDLQLEFAVYDEALTLSLRYNADRFSDPQMERLVGHFGQLVRAVTADVNRPVSEYNVLLESETALIGQLNATDRVRAEGANVVSRFESQVHANPNATALVCGNRAFTYGELNAAVNRAAHCLSQQGGIAAGGRVGILLGRSDAFIISVWAVLKLGAAYVPLDPEYPAERIAYALQDSGVDVLLTDTATWAGAGVAFDNVVRWESIVESPEGYPSSNPDRTLHAGDLAYILYTSGSTGLPKGIMIEQGSLSDYVWTFIEYFDLDLRDVVVQQSSVAFDTLVEEIFPVLCVGGKLVVSPGGGRDVEALLALIEAEKVSLLSTTPLVVNELNGQAHRAKGLRVLISGGDELKPAYITDLIRYVPVYNTYGPTECTVCSLYHRVERAEEAAVIGKPISNRHVYLLDASLNPVPVGVTGELCISGKGLARGYVGRAAESAGAFVAHPFRAGERLYKTGDLGRYLESGAIAFLGRKDDQTKIQGHRVEPGEIEAVLLRHDAVADAVVLVDGDARNLPRLVACYRSRQNELDLRAYLSKRLPAHMVPAAFVRVDHFPKTANGKIDRKALLQAGRGIAGGTSGRRVAPRNPREEKLLGLYRAVLGKEEVGVEDNFFESGGNSITAIRLLSLVHKEFNAELTFKQFFYHSTVAGLAAVLTPADGAAPNGIGQAEEREDYALSDAQQRLWIIHQVEGPSNVYNMFWAYHLNGALDVPCFTRALAAIVARHESLRTVFVNVGGAPRQRVLPSQSFHFERDCFEFMEAAGDEQVSRLVLAERDFVFDFAQPLVRARLVRVAPEKHIFTLSLHHIIADAWSMEVFLKELTTLYRAYRSGSDNPLAPLPIQYKDYTHWQHRYLASAQAKADGEYWQAKFAGQLPVLNIPADFDRPVQKTYNGSCAETAIDPSVLGRINTYCEANGVTLFMFLVAGFKTLLFRYAQQDDIVVGLPVAGREHHDLENQIGFYVNTLPFRTKLDGDDTFAGLLGTIKRNLLEDFEHQKYPFNALVENLHLVRDVSRSPLFDVMVVLQNKELSGVGINGMEGIAFEKYRFDKSICSYDLIVRFVETGDKVEVCFDYNTDLFAAATVARMQRHFHAIVDAVLADRTTRVRDIALLSAAERGQITGTFNATEWAYPATQTLVDLFEEQAARTPGHRAVFCEGKAFTYRQLSEKSGRLANYLRHALRIGPGDFVAIMAQPSEWLMVGILGILKAGAAYVPVSPQYPKKRIDHVLTDAQVRGLITFTECLPLSEGYAGEVIVLDGEATVPATGETGIAPVNTPHDVAYVIYTSGSTGNAKGVLIDHQSVVNLVGGLNQQIFDRYQAPLQVALLASCVFDASVQQIFGTLLNGHCLHVIADPVKKDPMRMWAYLIEQQIEVTDGTPSYLNLLRNAHPPLAGLALRHLIIGGEALPKQLAKSFMQLLESSRHRALLTNVYGPTECCVDVTYFTIGEAGADQYRSVPIGKPMANKKVYIVEEGMGLLPVGVEGEICIGGVGVGQGYLNRAELTEQKFVANPFGPGRLYRTGDRGRWLPDGNIEYLGRNDGQIKLRGHRIELGEIENTLLKHPAVANAVVELRTLPATTQASQTPQAEQAEQVTAQAGEAYLVAYLVGKQPSSNGQADKQELSKQALGKLELSNGRLREFISGLLPAYMVPAYFVVLEQLPLTA
ncbi:MAG: amino acid adenylation domain-containing protein, partial [Cytophagales bacterium]|nr:amino acid adenylation domain-containing protein [Cytophagales bacterium]